MAVYIPKSGLIDAVGGKLASIVVKFFLVGDIFNITTRRLLVGTGEKRFNKYLATLGH